jgi:hypothetical protein
MKIIQSNAETVYINHDEASYGIFCFNDKGDLFLNSDWGFFGYAWRAYGENFKEFLSSCNSDYIIGKFGINYCETSGKKIPPHKEKYVKVLIDQFINHLKTQVQTQDITKII